MIYDTDILIWIQRGNSNVLVDESRALQELLPRRRGNKMQELLEYINIS